MPFGHALFVSFNISKTADLQSQSNSQENIESTFVLSLAPLT